MDRLISVKLRKAVTSTKHCWPRLANSCEFALIALKVVTANLSSCFRLWNARGLLVSLVSWSSDSHLVHYNP